MVEDSTDSKQIEHENRPYAFAAYSSEWPRKFADVADTVRPLLGDEIIELEHVGSTSIPGMPSKPQIDVLVVVKDLSVMPQYYDVMQEHGYTARGDYTNEGEEYYTKDTAEGNREVSIHVLPDGHHWATELLDFRDYLRSHPDELAYYAETKEKMHRKFPNDYTNYYKGKLPVVLELIKRATEWRGHNTSRQHV
jgi:GrpB-like predicted nucleotidyltransferase (UPF0157 family)